MTAPEVDYERLVGAEVHGSDDKIGKVEQLFADRENGAPTFASVDTGLLDFKGHLMPLAEASVEADTVRVPYTKNQVKGAPKVDTDGGLDPEEEDRLYEHYGLTPPAEEEEPPPPRRATRRGPPPPVVREGGPPARRRPPPPEESHAEESRAEDREEVEDVEESDPDEAPEVTLAAERLEVGRRVRERGRARLRRYVVTEEVTRTLPVMHEEVRVERESLDSGETLDRDLSEEDYEITLHEERPVVRKEVVPQERVRLRTEEVVEQRRIRADVRREDVDVDEVREVEGD